MCGKYSCIRLQFLLSYKFVKTKDWLNKHNDYYKTQQNLEYKLTGLTSFKNLFKWANVLGRGVISGKPIP